MSHTPTTQTEEGTNMIISDKVTGMPEFTKAVRKELKKLTGDGHTPYVFIYMSKDGPVCQTNVVPVTAADIADQFVKRVVR